MEEDIKILEEKIEEWEPYKNIDFPTETGKLIQKENQALENLIKGYRELESELNKLNSYILINGIDEGLKTATQIKLENQSQYLHQKQVENLKEKIEYLKANSIPKSKIKEKIEELNTIKDNKEFGLSYGDLLNFVDDLQELMEDK